jgi:hypothetical protein
MKKPKYHNIRDAKGRFVKPYNIEDLTPRKMLTAGSGKIIFRKPVPKPNINLPGIDNDQVIPSYPNLIKENSAEVRIFDSYGKDQKGRNFERVDSASTAHTGFGDEPTAPHSVLNKTKSALIWFSLGVLSGVIAWVGIEYSYHLFNPCR